MSELEGGVTIVTGGARGIGAAIAERLVASGRHVLAGDIEWDGASVAKDPAITRFRLDVRDPETLTAAIEEASAVGPVTGLVNCAGVLRATVLEDLDETGLALMWDVNVLGITRFCAEAAQRCEQLEAIVNIGSISPRLPRLPGVALYGATKAAVEVVSRALAAELGPRGIRVNTLAPGFIEVPMSDDMRAISGGEESAATQVPLGRMGQPAEIAEVTEFLLSRRASYIHGAVIVADGGATAY
ncbi:MAG TPA: SDR family oxidoreductase [Solirubrobacterales bacterium]|nr:SDR family oxidoreductase [Solirubrobacterales bacterium]